MLEYAESQMVEEWKMLSWDFQGSQEYFKTDDVSFYTTYYYT